MAVYQDREAFIPYRRTDIINLCLEDGKLSVEQEQKFRDFCEILSAYYHFKYHQTLESLKDNFVPFNPNPDTKSRVEHTRLEKKEMSKKLVDGFKTLLQAANYVYLSKSSLQRAFKEKSLLDLKTEVDFNDFDRIVCYCRGDIYKVTYVKKFFRRIEKRIDLFERVALLIKCKEKNYFERRVWILRVFLLLPEKFIFIFTKIYLKMI